MHNPRTYLLRVTPDKAHVSPPQPPSSWPLRERLALVNAWRGTQLKHAQDQTIRVAKDLGRSMDLSPFKGDCRIKTVFENIRVIEVELNDDKAPAILALLLKHPEVKPYDASFPAPPAPPAGP
ncbi:MAG: hypothetical protein PW788_14075 [Micavibrio sp.]|nr:hypothetical protein [Micavibrio sp.]